MKIRNLLAMSALAATAFASAANANHRSNHGYGPSRALPSYTISARVVEVRPVYRWVRRNRPSTNCHYEKVVHERNVPGKNNALKGAFLGALIGRAASRNRRHRGRNVAAGAIVGGIIGSRNSRPGHTDTHVENRRVCRRNNNFHEQRVFQNYFVVYRVRGRSYSLRTRRHPGRRIRLRITARPIL